MQTEKLIFCALLQEEKVFTGWGTDQEPRRTHPRAPGSSEQQANGQPAGIAKDGLDDGRGDEWEALRSTVSAGTTRPLSSVSGTVGPRPTTREEPVQPWAHAREREPSPSDVAAHEGDGHGPAVTANGKHKQDPPHRGLHSASPVGGQEGGSRGPRARDSSRGRDRQSSSRCVLWLSARGPAYRLIPATGRK